MLGKLERLFTQFSSKFSELLIYLFNDKLRRVTKFGRKIVIYQIVVIESILPLVKYDTAGTLVIRGSHKNLPKIFDIRLHLFKLQYTCYTALI